MLFSSRSARRVNVDYRCTSFGSHHFAVSTLISCRHVQDINTQKFNQELAGMFQSHNVGVCILFRRKHLVKLIKVERVCRSGCRSRQFIGR